MTPTGKNLLPDARRQVRFSQRYTELVWQEFTCHDIEYHHIAEALGHLEMAHEHLLKAIKEHAVPLRVRT